MGIAVYARASDDLTRAVFARLTAVADVKADALDRWIDEQRRNVVFVGAVLGFGDDARTMLDADVPVVDQKPPANASLQRCRSSSSRPATRRSC